MKRNHIIFLFLFLLFTACKEEYKVDTDWPEVTKEAKPWTRWWWMGSAVDKPNLTYHLEAMSLTGIGGVEITPIYGVKGQEENYIPFLSPEWMDILKHTQSEAERLGMGMDMNNGTGWPFGGPDISIEDAAVKSIFQTYFLSGEKTFKQKITVDDPLQKKVARLECLMAYSDNGQTIDLTNRVQEDGTFEWNPEGNKEWKLIALFLGKTFQQVKRAAPGGEGYVLNHLDANAVQRYLGKFDKAFKNAGVSYPHRFFNDSYEVYGADWTPTLLTEFEKKRGYKLQNYFPELLADGTTDTSVRVITDYRETVSDIVRENFTTLWTDWAHQNGTITRNQAHGSPANLIDLYASVDIPECESFGITDFDIPYLRKDSIRKENDGDPTTLKYASSAAHIAGKKYTSSETFTWLTEHFRTSLSQCKPEVDQMFLAGVNHIFFHGSTYSPQDAEWPGWLFYASVNMSPTNSLWKDAPAFFEYITRVQSFLQTGTPDNDFLLYMPIYDIWNQQRGDIFLTFAIHGMRDKLSEFYEAVEKVKNSGYDLDYISDRFIQTTTVEDGWLKTEGGTRYKALILPAVKTLPIATMERIIRLAEEGATIIFVENYPEDVPGLKDLTERQSYFQELKTQLPTVNSFQQIRVSPLKKGKVITGKDYNKILIASQTLPEQLATEWGVQYLRRKHTDGYLYFLAMLQNKTVNDWIPLTVNARSMMIFDPMTGKKGKAKIRQKEGNTEAFLQLQPGESLIIKTFTDKDIETQEWTYYQPSGKEIKIEGPWKLSFSESDPEIQSSFTLPSLVSWTELEHEDLKKNRGTGRYETTIQVDKIPEYEYRLSLGDVRESARIYINGTEAGVVFAPPFEINIGDYLQQGENQIEIEVTNLPANRIADMDRNGKEWRIFHEINFVSITYQPTLFDRWDAVPSGLLGPVVIRELIVDSEAQLRFLE